MTLSGVIEVPDLATFPFDSTLILQAGKDGYYPAPPSTGPDQTIIEAAKNHPYFTQSGLAPGPNDHLREVFACVAVYARTLIPSQAVPVSILPENEAAFQVSGGNAAKLATVKTIPIRDTENPARRIYGMSIKPEDLKRVRDEIIVLRFFTVTPDAVGSILAFLALLEAKSNLPRSIYILAAQASDQTIKYLLTYKKHLLNSNLTCLVGSIIAQPQESNTTEENLTT